VLAAACGLPMLAACGSSATTAKAPTHTTEAEVCKALNVLDALPNETPYAKVKVDAYHFYRVASEASDTQVRNAGRVLVEADPLRTPVSYNPAASQAQHSIWQTCVDHGFTSLRPTT
jgi:hypothetical protein